MNMLGTYFYDLLTGVRSGHLGQEMYVRPQGLTDYDAVIHDADYYIASAEKDLWAECAVLAPQLMPQGLGVIEFGPGDAKEVEKISGVVRALACPSYTALDYSQECLKRAIVTMQSLAHGIKTKGVCEDYWNPAQPSNSSENGIMAGISVGNLTLPILNRAPVTELAVLLNHLLARLNGGRLMFTIDTKLPYVSGADYVRAYSQQCHADFNLAVLHRVAEETEITGFDPTKFVYRPVFHETAGQIAHMAYSETTQHIIFHGMKFTIEAGHSWHLQNSFKFRPETIELAFEHADAHQIHCIEHTSSVRLFIIEAKTYSDAGYRSLLQPVSVAA